MFIIFILFDVFYESYFGKNIIGFGGEIYGKRIVSFFIDEPIVGGYIYGFYLIILGFLFQEFNEKKNLIVLFSLIFLTAIILTGERSNTIKAFLAISIFYLTFKEFDLKKKIIFFTSTIIIFLVIILNSQYLKVRFIGQIKTSLTSNNLYFDIYKSGYEVFKNYKLFGAGNKNYRVETCKTTKINIEKNKYYHCQTHPHQIYFEFLSEHGLFGSIFLFFIFYKLIFSRFFQILNENNSLQMGSFFYLVIVFLPLLPGGAFFGDYMLTIFMLNLSVFYSSNQSLNIFSKDNYR